MGELLFEQPRWSAKPEPEDVSARWATIPFASDNHMEEAVIDYEASRPALIAFYERDCLPQKAENLRRGAPLDYLDRRAIEALQAAAALIPERKAA